MKIRIILSLSILATLVACDKPNEVESENPAVPAVTEVQNVDAASAAKLLKDDPGILVLDIRTPEEFSEGHIDGAKNIDFKNATFKAEIGKLDMGKSYIVHCRSGGRSGASLPTFRDLGFSRIYHLNGGFLDWSDSGLPVAK